MLVWTLERALGLELTLGLTGDLESILGLTWDLEPFLGLTGIKCGSHDGMELWH